MDEVAASGETVVITKHGVPITQLIPVRHRPKTMFGALSDSITIRGDILAPVDARWDAQS
ncbi:MAG: type II toxin-antitoxin system prevent-host-death family antitoxin [Dehalococcoidia bacterium]|nr:type II toxin-antitoxin system prevent-host-death family antitoxin [Dehalococcoidia bacterium]MSQ16362.1 type II toxin-antitoxin system prevent-host-death family antitoxin [Dehalococcoidia bacterium]